MRIAVVTAYCHEPIDVILRCHKSVSDQDLPATHFLVSDGHPIEEIDSWNVVHVRLPFCGDYGDTPRAVGAALAAAAHHEAVAFLDADNWFETEHLRTLMSLQERTKAAVVTATRFLRRHDGSLLGVCNQSDGHAFND